ncbi:MAG: hypothetical protein AAF629_32410 [Chloroflexota bacterium]
MPIYNHFYIEHYAANSWHVPNKYQPTPQAFKRDRPFGGFASAHPSYGWLTLFFGQAALFPMLPGSPADWGESPLLNYLKEKAYDFEVNEDQLWWLPFEELCLDSWSSEKILVGGYVEAHYALCFKDGQQPFPQASLSEMNVVEEQQWKIRNWGSFLIDQSENWLEGSNRYQLSQMYPTSKTLVTWQETIADFVGLPYFNLFTQCQGYGREEELRILSMRG